MYSHGPGKSQDTSAIQARLDDLLERVRSASAYLVGYPTTQEFDYSALAPFLLHSLNNVGTPTTTATTAPIPTR